MKTASHKASPPALRFILAIFVVFQGCSEPPPITTPVNGPPDLEVIRQYAVVSPRLSEKEEAPPLPNSVISQPVSSPVAAKATADGVESPAPVRSTFFGNEATGERIAYVVDYSGSMLDAGREELLVTELTKSLTSLPKQAKYTLIMFMGEAWWHENSPGLETHFSDADGHWLPATNANLSRSLEILRAFTIEVANHSSLQGGTDWSTGLTLALGMQPKPEVIHFMTDGVTDGGVKSAADSFDRIFQSLFGRSSGLSKAAGETDEALVRRVSALNTADGKPAAIHAVSMMEPQAARALGILAKENQGTFSIVTASGDVVLIEGP